MLKSSKLKHALLMGVIEYKRSCLRDIQTGISRIDVCEDKTLAPHAQNIADRMVTLDECSATLQSLRSDSWLICPASEEFIASEHAKQIAAYHALLLRCQQKLEAIVPADGLVSDLHVFISSRPCS